MSPACLIWPWSRVVLSMWLPKAIWTPAFSACSFAHWGLDIDVEGDEIWDAGSARPWHGSDRSSPLLCSICDESAALRMSWPHPRVCVCVCVCVWGPLVATGTFIMKHRVVLGLYTCYQARVTLIISHWTLATSPQPINSQGFTTLTLIGPTFCSRLIAYSWAMFFSIFFFFPFPFPCVSGGQHIPIQIHHCHLVGFRSRCQWLGGENGRVNTKTLEQSLSISLWKLPALDQGCLSGRQWVD